MPGPLPLLGLRAFAEVARAGSIQAAARTLGVTAGAVSQQVKALEVRLDVALFERRNRSLRLTDAGEVLLTELSDAFDRIETALEKLAESRGLARPALVVSTTASFAATWLAPRLGGFVQHHPDIDVRIMTTPELVPIGTGPGRADVGIRHGLGDWPGLHAVPLLQPRLVPVGSPSLLAAGTPIREPLDCLQYPLLHDSLASDWRLWLQAMGANYRDRRVTRGTRFSDVALLIRATVAGQGLALLRDTYVADEVAGGRLRIALDAPWPARFAYYVVTQSPPNELSATAASFTDWLRSEARS
jgi:LysR family transcriptional regulator, glycine cleavage system transcriptional activator